MKYSVEFSQDAERHLKKLSARRRKTILSAVEKQLTHQPATPTKNRKELRENPIAKWELRVQGSRVLYNVLEEESIVSVMAVAEKKGNRFVIEGEEFKL
ncbi:MAG: type II toxin-antitoxin system RelE/ParE family toxin [Gemmataceae bacterium]|nr:type II toxin-antitoxin system RelE/ParE family toxin [Gemmataceae bacterium]MCI0743492.1 type II toxin-antitoxin system RelE/ParE family toxin [Gemmataceae bacterium]